MRFPDDVRVRHLQSLFCAREAIYVEKGALRVRVDGIRRDVEKLVISAELSEIPTPGFPAGVFCAVLEHEPSPLRLTIGAGFMSDFSDSTWYMGYGGWSLFFAPRIVDRVVALAGQFPEDLHPMERYKAVLRFLEEQGAYEPTQRLFAEQ
jgi:hypothetical protein